MNIEELRILCKDETIIITDHGMKKLVERSISLEAVKNAVMCGEIIEDYPTDYPFPSCLILGNGIHAVVASGNGYIWFITAYIPDPTKWEADLKTRKGI